MSHSPTPIDQPSRFEAAERPSERLWQQAEAALALGDASTAWDRLQDAIDADPAYLPAWIRLGELALAAGEARLAIDYWRAALKLAPQAQGIWLSIAQAQRELDDPAAASVAYAAYLAAYPDDAEAWQRLAQCHHARGWTFHEAECLERYCSLRPQDTRMLRWQGMIRFYFGDWDWLRRFFPAVLELAGPLPEIALAQSAGAIATEGTSHDDTVSLRRLLELDYQRYLFTDPEVDDTTLFTWIRHCQASEPPQRQRRGQPKGPGPLRIGYLSGEFGNFASALLFWPLYLHAGPDVALHIYDDTPPEHAEPGFRPRDLRWRRIWGQTDEAVAAAIQNDGIDVLVDLTGITHQRRHGVYAAHPAPVQISGFGFVFSSGLACMDYCISDRVLCPPPIEALYPEKVVKLESAFHWQPPKAFTLGEPPCLEQGHLTLGAAHTLNRLQPRVIDLWARILHALPEAKLFLKTVVLADPKTQALYRARFAAHGIDPARIRLEGHGSGHHVSYFYPQIDIALDPFPYSGGVTTSEALWMGVPVAVMDQPQWRARALSVSIYHSLGLQDWLAHSEDEYLERVVAWAQDREFLRIQRQQLRQRLLNSSICDGPGFAREAEALFASLRHAATG